MTTTQTIDRLKEYMVNEPISFTYLGKNMTLSVGADIDDMCICFIRECEDRNLSTNMMSMPKSILTDFIDLLIHIKDSDDKEEKPRGS